MEGLLVGVSAGLVGLFVVLTAVLIYNNLVVLRSKVENGWARVNVQLKKRHDLVPKLVETVKGYASHERRLLTKVTRIRAKAMDAKELGERGKLENALTSAVWDVFAVAENYPALKASHNFMQVQKELSRIEERIAYARNHYNDCVMDYNVMVQGFPSGLVAWLLGFGKGDYLEMEEAII